MKRSSPLARRKRLRAHVKPSAPQTARQVWKEPRWGFCAVCGAEGRLSRHHVLYEQKLRRLGREDVLWDLRNSLDVGDQFTCDCHHSQHRALRGGVPWRIPLPLVSDAAVAFAVDVLGGDVAAAVWFARYYAAELPEAPV